MDCFSWRHCALAAVLPLSVVSATASPAADPASPAAITPPVRYASVFSTYQYAADPTTPPNILWRRASQTPASQAGHEAVTGLSAGDAMPLSMPMHGNMPMDGNMVMHEKRVLPGERTMPEAMPIPAHRVTHKKPAVMSMPPGMDMHEPSQEK